MEKVVLLVEDDPRHFDRFEELLTQAGCKTLRKANNFPVDSYEDAIAFLNSGTHVDYAVLDINLRGDKTGVDIVQYILENKLPIKTVLTTSYLDNLDIAKRIAYIGGPQYGIITKNNGVIDKRATLFVLTQLLNPVNPLLAEQIEYTWVKAKTVNPNQNIRNQLNNDELKYHSHRIERNAITYVLVGSNKEIKGLPKNKAIILTNITKEAYLTDMNLTQLKESGTLGSQFVQINANVIINLKYYEYVAGKDRRTKKIVVLGNMFEVTEKYAASFHNALVSYKLVPLSPK